MVSGGIILTKRQFNRTKIDKKLAKPNPITFLLCGFAENKDLSISLLVTLFPTERKAALFFLNPLISFEENKIEKLQSENKIYQKQLKDSLLLPIDIRNTQTIYNKISNNIVNISNLEIEVNQYKQNVNDSTCWVNITINDELSTPNNSRVSFVNMPGLEYGLLKTENPVEGTSASMYQGLSVKYMFTRGKSYFNLGVYKALENNKSDTSLINELFLINFGQDFYPKNFGRGKRKFLNLYTGYQIGGFITNQNNNKNSEFIPNANLSIGLELFKNKYILIDNKVSYFLPLNELNRNMRGILYQASFNFVF